MTWWKYKELVKNEMKEGRHNKRNENTKGLERKRKENEGVSNQKSVKEHTRQ